MEASSLVLVVVVSTCRSDVVFSDHPVFVFCPLSMVGAHRFNSMPTVDYLIVWVPTSPRGRVLPLSALPLSYFPLKTPKQVVVVVIALAGCVLGVLLGLSLVAAQFIWEAECFPAANLPPMSSHTLFQWEL